MPDTPKLKVFISWSGALSKGVATVLRDWIPMLFDSVVPFMSETDIEAGQRGLRQIEDELNGTSLGIIVVTAENQHAPWLNFEAGALSKAVSGDMSVRVIPLLVDLAGPAQIQGPISQFQAKMLDASGMRDLVRTIGQLIGVRPEVAEARCDTYWPRLADDVEAAKSKKGPRTVARRRPEDILDELLVHVRALRTEQDMEYSVREAHVGSVIVDVAKKHGLSIVRWTHGRRLNGQLFIKGIFSADSPTANLQEWREDVSDFFDATVLTDTEPDEGSADLI